MNALDGLSIAILLFVLGSSLLVAEVFFPSGGALGFLSATALIAAVYFGYQHGGVTSGLGVAAAEIVLLPILLYAALMLLPRTPMGKVLVGEAPTSEEVLPESDTKSLVGEVGVARTKMLPAGSVEIGGRMLNAISQGQAIEPGEYVKVVEATRTRVVVRRAPPDQRPRTTGVPEDALAKPATELGLDNFEFDDPGDEKDSPA